MVGRAHHRAPARTGIGTVGHGTDVGGWEVYTDNTYLKLLQEQGIPVGLVFILGVFGSTCLTGRKLVHAGPLGKPLGVAGLAGFVSFLTLCLVAEYVEQPGKALAWTLLGVAVWGRIQS